MSNQEMIDWFKIIQDMYGSPYFTDDEYLRFLNQGQLKYVNNLFPDNEGGIINIEWDSNILNNASTIIYELPATTQDSTGKITNTSMVSSLRTLSGDTEAEIIKPLSIEYKKGSKRFACRVLRHNDKGAFEQNYFKKPSQFSPRYLFQNKSFQFRPTDINTQIFITVVKTPVAISLSPDVSCELPVSTHNEVVAYGLQFAGIASRDEVLSAMNILQAPK